MKVLWICQFSNLEIRNELQLSISSIEKLYRKIIGMKSKEFHDIGAWINNGIKEFEKREDIELHVISPHTGLRKKTEYFALNGIHYHFFKSDTDFLFQKFKRHGLKHIKFNYKRNRKFIQKTIEAIKPDIIHLYGAENPQYSISALDIDASKIPFIVSLQTLMSDPEFIEKYPISLAQYQFRADIERKILKKTKYIGSKVTKYREIVWNSINPNAIFFESGVAVAEKIVLYEAEKIYDFVYFAASINKAVDVAIESFAIACQKHPSLTLNIIGGSSPSFNQQLEDRIAELGIKENIIFSGKLPKHEDVLKQIQKSKYALLPLKIDYISGTIREAMFSEIPVVTTTTYGTPSLNEKRESVLISKQGDYQAMAQHIIRLIESPELTKKLKKNGLLTVNEKWNNNKIIKEIVKVYQAIYEHQHFNKPITTGIGTTNPKIK